MSAKNDSFLQVDEIVRIYTYSKYLDRNVRWVLFILAEYINGRQPAKKFDSGQPARIAQAELGRYFYTDALTPFSESRANFTLEAKGLNASRFPS